MQSAARVSRYAWARQASPQYRRRAAAFLRSRAPHDAQNRTRAIPPGSPADPIADPPAGHPQLLPWLSRGSRGRRSAPRAARSSRSARAHPGDVHHRAVHGARRGGRGVGLAGMVTEAGPRIGHPKCTRQLYDAREKAVQQIASPCAGTAVPDGDGCCQSYADSGQLGAEGLGYLGPGRQAVLSVFGGEGPHMPGSRGEDPVDGPVAVFPPTSGRAAAMPRLLDLDGRGELTAAHVRLVARALGKSERTVWRWLAAAREDHRLARMESSHFTVTAESPAAAGAVGR